MTTANDARKAHKILDNLFKGKPVLDEEREFLRSTLPELPKQKTLEEIIIDVRGAWSCTSGNDWGGDICNMDVSIEDWLSELYVHLKGLKGAEPTEPAPAHPEFLETEADYENAPDGTIVARSNQIPWVKENRKQWSCISGAVANCSMAQHKPRQILRWGWGE